jgi:hypothetical protein
MWFQFSHLHTLENTKQTNKTLHNRFRCCLSYGWTMHHSPGMNKNMWGVRLILRPCLEHRVLCVCPHWRFDHKDIVRQSYRSVHEFTKLITQRFQVHKVHLATAYADIKECAVIKEFCVMQSSCCWRLFNQIFIVEANSKFHRANLQNPSYTYKITKNHYKFQNSKYKPIVSHPLSLSIHYTHIRYSCMMSMCMWRYLLWCRHCQMMDKSF